jgi:2-oxoglutarate/2-oxoacid ferredoxin oxidoreductase subunit alpha
MNPETAREDVLSLEPGAAVVYDEPLKLNACATTSSSTRCPSTGSSREVCKDAKLRRLVKNMIYDGVLSKLLGDRPRRRWSRRCQAARQEAKAVALNQGALKAGFDYAAEHLEKRDPVRRRADERDGGKILVEGTPPAPSAA